MNGNTRILIRDRFLKGLKRLSGRRSLVPLLACAVFAVSCNGRDGEGEGTGGTAEVGNDRVVETQLEKDLSGDVYYLRRSITRLGFSGLWRYDLEEKKHYQVGAISGIAIGESIISRNGRYFIFEGIDRNREAVIGITPIKAGALEWEKTTTFPFGDEELRVNYDDWDNRVYFSISEPDYISGVGAISEVVRLGYISLDSEPYSVEYIDGKLKTSFLAISKRFFYCFRYVDGAMWFVRSPKSGGHEEKLLKRPFFTDRALVLNSERYCVFSRSDCDMVAGTSKQWLSVAKLSESNSEGGTVFKDYDVPSDYGVNVVQPPPSLGLGGVLLETYNPVSKRDGISYRRIAFFDLENGDIVPLFECPKGPIGDIPQVIAWLDLPDVGEGVVGTGAVNNR